jgi:hypothetical protein
VILSAKDSLGLDTWLRREKYKIPSGAEKALRPYVQAGMKFFVAKVNVKKAKYRKGQAILSPLRFHYDSKAFALPVRLGLLNSGGTQDLLIHILARDVRYEVSNYENVSIPTNLDVAESAREQFGSFYAALFDGLLERNPGSVVTEYAWGAGGCDPCPSDLLTVEELATLGADVLPTYERALRGRASSKLAMTMPGDFVLTRLHARYGKDALGEDLVFEAAPPIEGGREVRDGEGKLEEGARSAEYGINNFQARYAIRHKWTGPVACEQPVYGVWGGPPPEVNQQSLQVASDPAFASRGADLAMFVPDGVPELDSVAEHLPSGGVKPPDPDPIGAMRTGRSGCASCRVDAPAGGTFVLLVLLGLARRRWR